MQDLRERLQTTTPTARLQACRALRPRDFALLYAACAALPPLSLDELVPAGSDGEPVIFAGKNSLAAFSHFEKRFVRYGNEIFGYNHQTMAWLTGPGYFSALAEENRRELLFDYDRIPTRAPEGWPPIRENRSGFSRLVFHNLHDYCRRVCDGVLIGSATRLGKPMNSYFILARAK